MLSSPETQVQNKDVEKNANAQQTKDADENEKKNEQDNERSTDEHSEGNTTGKKHTVNDNLDIKEVQPLDKDDEIIPEQKEKKTDDGDGQSTAITESRP